MLHPDALLVGLSGRELANWWRLALPPGVFAGKWALVVRPEGDGSAGSFALVRGRGRVELGPGAVAVDEAALEALRTQLGADFLVAVDERVLEGMSATAESRAGRERDYLGQWLCFYDVVRQHRERGVWSSPALLDILPPLGREPLHKAFDFFVPNGTAMVGYVFDGDGIHASVIATKADGQIDCVANHPAIANRVSAADLREWRRGYRAIGEAVREAFAPPSLAVYADEAAIRRVQRGPGEQLSRELAQRNIIIDPMPTWLAGLVGGAAAAAIAARSAQALSRFLPRSARRAAESVADAARERLRESPSSPLAVLGFDPLRLWATMQKFYKP